MLIVSAVAWVLLLADPGGAMMSAHDPAAHASAMAPASLSALFWMQKPASLAAGWGVDVGRDDVAGADFSFRSPALEDLRAPEPPRHHAFRRGVHRDLDFAWRRVGGSGIGGRAVCAEIVPSGGGRGTRRARCWGEVSPIKQRCLNRCHADPEISAFGVAADIDALRFGTMHGIWCAGSCWALMLCPMLAHVGANPRDGRRDPGGFQRTARTAKAAVLACARAR